ncbi:ATP-dependent Clp protease ATP-binding subunit ClpA [Alkalithermobacter thermoalcaliphilus JW-YL-7 = DSM 7308]|uniref:ATP-dependent Clp protease ATP-binding subunit ClpA n=1 Tax=Alkalithermobacter thermoalcaliphilus JW-YL-7 = DSM 7308 TaxID=1121328 RepID=A0A150FP08_CLOPD|nr:ATPase AAA-2 domain protein [[Clostridium] paradoxum JW-YL-7 = DSM 7308]SHK54536.1 ATP-dependent Clp protease ATP-binding subunit ClpA [[Clostridium] paradoxum JW-YL-7 = DSM 7308]
MKKCSVCNKNIAIAFVSKIENGKTEMKGICIECAKKLGLPIMDQILEQTGMSEEDIESLAKDMSASFEESEFDEEIEDDLFNNLLGNLRGLYKNEKETKSSINEKSSVKKQEKEKKNKYLEMYGTNLIEKAKNNEIDNVIGREKEIERVIQILNRRNKNNPILLGEPGVGKTAIAEGLALKVVQKQVPPKLYDAKIYLLDLTAIVAGTQFRGQFEGRMKSIIKEAQESKNVILVIDEVHNIMGAGEVHGGVMNAANILKPALARGEIQIIGATTLEEYRKHIEKDAALERRFQPVKVKEPNIEESIEILKGIRKYYEDFHKVKISDEVIEASVKLSQRYIQDRYLPDKAIDIIDEAGSKVNLANKYLIEIQNLKEDLENIQNMKEQAAINNDYEAAARYKMKECELKDKIKALEDKAVNVEVTIEDVASVIESWTKIPVKKITQQEAEKLLNLEEILHNHVIGQHKAVESVAKAIRRNRSGFRKKKKPSSFIFVGPTGVGKTQLVKALAKELFGTEEAMISIDMSEYMEKHTVSKLIGAPPGYVGYDEGGQLTEKVRRRPYSVILLDEIEKAHPDVFNMLLQVLEEGRLTDSQGRTVSFENTIIIMTSNAGSSVKSNTIGFSKDNYETLENKAKNALKEIFRPEFLNRVDDIIVFTSLTRKQLRKIIDLMLKEVEDEVKEKGMEIEISDEVKEFVLDKGYDEKYGARPLRKAIQRYIEDEIAEKYLQNKFKEGDTIKVSLQDGKVIVS